MHVKVDLFHFLHDCNQRHFYFEMRLACCGFAVSLQIRFHNPPRKVVSAKLGYQSNLSTIRDLTNWSLHQNLVYGMAASKECLKPPSPLSFSQALRSLLRSQFPFYPIPTAKPIHRLVKVDMIVLAEVWIWSQLRLFKG